MKPNVVSTETVVQSVLTKLIGGLLVNAYTGPTNSLKEEVSS
jgi:hypothetical protein